MFGLRMGLTARTAYRGLKRCILSLPASLILDGEEGRGTSNEDADGPRAKVYESWFSVQDQEPGHMCLLYLRVLEELDCIQILGASTNLEYSRCLLLKVQGAFESQLTEEGMLPKDQHLAQITNYHLREGVGSIKIGLLDTVVLANSDMAAKLEAASEARERAFSSLRELELRAGKELADKGRVKRRAN